MVEYFKADRTLPTRLEPAWQKIAQSSLNDTTQFVDSEEEGRNHGQTMADRKKILTLFNTYFSDIM